jgi:hypothetical protein
MKARQARWAATPYPYGSEFGFDTTGQEEVVVWSLFFGNETTAKKTVDHILSYMRSSPTWAYNGGSRSWGDIGNNGKYLVSFGTGVNDRGCMHYRSGLNMIPLIEWYRGHPDDYFLLEVSMGAIGGQMTNIDETGATSMMWHALPHVLDWDPHSGDYGLGFFGNALEGGAYYVHHPELGPVCYLCSTAASSPEGDVAITPEDAYKTAVFVEPMALLLQADCGRFAGVVWKAHARKVLVQFEAGTICIKFRLRVTKTAEGRPGSGFVVSSAAELKRGAYEIKPAAAGKTTEATISYTN